MSSLASPRTRQVVATVITGAVVTACVVFTLLQLQPHLLVAGTTPAGGDMGAHVWGPAYLRDHLLPHGRVTGWTPDWYAGFPAYHFYMVVPSLFIVLLDVVLPYGVAFKLVSVSGLLGLPIAACAFGRLARMPFPGPALLAVATVPFIFDRNFTILGGNAGSTLAGEFAFSISLTLAVLFLGVVVRGLDTGRLRALAAVLLALCALSHIIPAFFAAAGVVVWAGLMGGRGDDRARWFTVGSGAAAAGALALLLAGLGGLVRLPGGVDTVVDALVVLLQVVAAVGLVAAFVLWVDPARRWWVASAAVTAGAITAFWALPFVARRAYMNDMGWEKRHEFLPLLFPGRLGEGLTKLVHRLPIVGGGDSTTPLGDVPGMNLPSDITWVVVLAVFGVVLAWVYRRRVGMFFSLMALIAAVAFVLAPQGRLWNARLLPFWYLSLYALAAVGVVEIARALATVVARDTERPPWGVLVAAPVVALAAILVTVGLPLRALPGGTEHVDEAGNASYRWLGIETTERSFVPDWARWNYSGYERKDAYPEYRAIVETMGALGEERGCGRAMWEYEPELDRYGTPMALMLLPYWTDGCIGSMEGLYFEASATTPYHFLNQSELSQKPSRAQRDLPYSSLDVDRGVEHLQMLGVRYYLATSEEATAAADAHADLTPLATSGPWHVYEVADAELVEPLRFEPAVLDGVDGGHLSWLDPAVRWYVDGDAWDVALAADGPDGWQRVQVRELPPAPTADGSPAPETVGDVEIDELEERRLPTARVRDVREGDDRISFRVDRTGVPVVVKSSYFPNWRASGAEGPYRVAPNLMVVIPTERHVELHYGTTAVDRFAWLVTLLGLAGAVVLARRPGLRVPEPPSPAEPEEELDDDIEAELDALSAALAPAGAGSPSPESERDRPLES